MTLLWKTRPSLPGTARACALLWIAFAALGCGSVSPGDSSPVADSTGGARDPDWLTSRERLPAPDTDRIEYDVQKRTLILYDLPGRDRWMVQLPDEAKGRPVGPQHRLPDGIDTARTWVYYARPGARISVAVSIDQIAAGRGPHSSIAFIR